MGTPQAAAVSLQRLIDDGHEIAAVYTQPDRPKGRGQKVTVSAVKELAIEAGLKIVQPVSLKSPDALETFRSFAADVAVVVAYGRILPKEFLTASPHGAVNVHFSLLPKYRGAAPVNWAIVNGEEVTGVTTMRMDEGLDTGDILLQKEVWIGERQNSAELTSRLALAGAELLAETLSRIGSIEPRPQDGSQASYAPLLKRSDGVIDWRRPAEETVRRIRGLQPFPTAFTFYGAKRLTIWSATAEKAASLGTHEPGMVTVDGGRLSVACGAETDLSIEELQFEGKRRMSVKEFLNGVSIRSGEVLGRGLETT